MIKTFILCILLTFYLTVTGQNRAGYFDYNKLRASCALNDDVEKFLSAFRQHLSDSLNLLSRSLDHFYTTGIPDGSHMDTASAKDLEGKMNARLKAVSDYQEQAHERYDREVKILELEMKAKLTGLVKQYFTDHKMFCLADRAAILYCDSCTDYTDGLINALHSHEGCYPTRSASKDDSATVIIKNISHSKFSEYIAVIRNQIIAGKNLKPGQSRSFRISLAGANVNRFTIYLDKDGEYKYSIEPMDYLQNVSDVEITGGTYQYLVDIDKVQDVLSVRLEKIN